MEIAGININDNDLIFLPLGGSNEIGMNMNLYHFAGKWIIVDLGISFGDDTMPGSTVRSPRRREHLRRNWEHTAKKYVRKEHL